MIQETENKKALNFSIDSLNLDAAQETERIVTNLREMVHHTFHRQGAVVGISGGIDSAVVLGLCAQALGPDRVIGILLPERESSPESITLAHQVAQKFGVQTITEDLTGVLEGYGCYSRRDEAIRRIFPEYGANWKVKIVLPNDLLQQGTLNIFRLVVTDPSGKEYTQRLPLKEYSQIVASSNFKQRSRTNMLYYHSELRNYAMIGTPNKNEHDLGFYVKFGDGGYDVAPIRHLFKTQVYQLARFLGVPEDICQRPPSTDTYPGGGTQEEFYYRIPFKILDAVWLGFELGVASDAIGQAVGLTTTQVDSVIMDIKRKQTTSMYLKTASEDIFFAGQSSAAK